jgi:cellulose synthase/poly-beta-1,6-N-acetylglucosamine synthase-like glycosyltransferase
MGLCSDETRLATMTSARLPASEDMPEVSIVVPAYRGRHVIAECLTALRLAVRGIRAEILVVESSGDGTADLLRSQFPEVSCIQSPQRLSAGAARQRGLSAARARFVFCVDQDCTVPADWIPRLLAHFGDPTVGAVGGAVSIRNPHNLSGSAVYFLEFFRHFPSRAASVRDANFLVGCNSAYRAEALASATIPDMTLGEDVLFSQYLRDAGWRVVYDARVAVAHQNREGWLEFLNYCRAMGRAAADTQAELRVWWGAPFLRWPMLVYLTPVPILVRVLSKVLRSRWSYALTFVALLPTCLVGSAVWAHAFSVRARARCASNSEDSKA